MNEIYSILICLQTNRKPIYMHKNWFTEIMHFFFFFNSGEYKCEYKIAQVGLYSKQINEIYSFCCLLNISTCIYVYYSKWSIM